MFLYKGWNRKLNKKHVTFELKHICFLALAFPIHLWMKYRVCYSNEIAMVLKSNDFLFMTFLFELQAPYKSRETELLLAAFFSEEDSRPPKSKLLLPLAL